MTFDKDSNSLIKCMKQMNDIYLRPVFTQFSDAHKLGFQAGSFV